MSRAALERINSSNVPPDFKSDDLATDPAMVEEARRLSAEIEQTSSLPNTHLPQPTSWRPVRRTNKIRDISIVHVTEEPSMELMSQIDRSLF